MVVFTVPSRENFSIVYVLSKSALETQVFCLGQIWSNVGLLISVVLSPASTATMISCCSSFHSDILHGVADLMLIYWNSDITPFIDNLNVSAYRLSIYNMAF